MGSCRGWRSRGRLGDAEVDQVLREIRVALLEADVNLNVVRDLIERIRGRCSGAELSKSLSPAQQVIKVVNEELTATLGGEPLKISYASRPADGDPPGGPARSRKDDRRRQAGAVVQAAGPQPFARCGGPTATCCCRAVAWLGRDAGVQVFSEPTDPVSVASGGVAEATRLGRDVVIVDTAGRLAIDESLMNEVRRISVAVKPDYTFLVVDAMTGQDAVRTAEAFNETLELDGVILTKVDGDARGGAALSVKQVVGKPIAFVSTGERLGEFETFHPDRLASRILGMGDVMSLIEKAEREYDEGVAERGSSD